MIEPFFNITFARLRNMGTEPVKTHGIVVDPGCELDVDTRKLDRLDLLNGRKCGLEFVCLVIKGQPFAIAPLVEEEPQPEPEPEVEQKPIHKMRKDELVELCEKRGLDSEGTKRELLERLSDGASV